MVSLPQAVDKGIAFADGRNLPVPSMHFVHISAPRAALQAVALRNGACGRTSGDLNGAKSDAHVAGFCIEFFSRLRARNSAKLFQHSEIPLLPPCAPPQAALARQKGFFPTRMSPEKILKLSFLTS